MLGLFVAWLGIIALFVWAYHGFGRCVATGSLGLLSAPFIVGAMGVAGTAQGDAERLLWLLLAAFAVPAGLIGWWRRR